MFKNYFKIAWRNIIRNKAHTIIGFAYKETLSWWIFVVAGLLASVIALLTISFQAIKAAVANPVKSLRTE